MFPVREAGRRWGNECENGERETAAASGPSSHIVVHEVGTLRLVYSFLSGRGLALLDDFLGSDPHGTSGVFVG